MVLSCDLLMNIEWRGVCWMEFSGDLGGLSDRECGREKGILGGGDRRRDGEIRTQRTCMEAWKGASALLQLRP